MTRHDYFKVPVDPSALESKDIHLHVSVLLRPDDVAVSLAETGLDASQIDPTRDELLELATRIYASRRLREKTISVEIFGEPAWDMLLALYCFGAKGEQLSVTSLSHAANAPLSTGLRWQKTLEEKQLIARKFDRKDGRRQFLELTPMATDLIENYLTRLFYCDKLDTPPL